MIQNLTEIRSVHIHCEAVPSENYFLLDYYAASSGNSLPTFRAQCVRGSIGCPETSVRNCRYSLRNIPEEAVLTYFRGGSLKSRCYLLFSGWKISYVFHKPYTFAQSASFVTFF